MSLLFTLALLACDVPADLAGFEVSPVRDYRVGDLPVALEVTAVDASGERVSAFCGTARVGGLEGIAETPRFSAGRVVLDPALPLGEAVVVEAGAARGVWEPDLRRLPGFLSLLPPLFAIVLAIATRQALLALFAGIWLGALFVHGWNPLAALLRTFDTHLVAAVADRDHAAILLFTMALGGMVGVMAKSGGTRALVGVISRRARTRRSGMVTTWASGLVVFFDDYANCLLVGNTLRPLTDDLKISREKLSYLVDSTAAPVATVALVSTWVGFQIGELEIVTDSPYQTFLRLLPYSFYSFFTIAFVLAVAASGRDFGPMLAAERRAAGGGGLLRPGAQPLMDRQLTEMAPEEGARNHWLTAVVPIAAVLVIVCAGLYVSGRAAAGEGASLREIIGEANSYAVLLWASFGGSAIALAMAIGMRTTSLGAALEAWVSGVRAMVVAVLILVLAWGLGEMCKDYLQTGPWLLSQVSPSPALLPVLTFFLCGLIAFATGSSFSTMAIVIPIAGPMAWALTGEGSGVDPDVAFAVRHATLAAVLSGAVFGDHCSPISDTTIMSSMASAADHIDHVRTQAPYAAVCGAVAALVGFVPAGFGVPPWLTLPIGIGILLVLLRLLGRRP
jgi:Na+/H+ antiporter NhaC